jgi:hypothetical protein
MIAADGGTMGLEWRREKRGRRGSGEHERREKKSSALAFPKFTP